jgi:hypothetical protein
LSAALLAPFWNKAYTIDDPAFLAGGRQMLRDPLHPLAFDLVWAEPYPEPPSLNGVAMFALLAPVVAAGGSEWVAHLLMYLALACGICGAVALALRLGLAGERARWVGLLVAASPAVLAMSSTAMPDVPSMTLGVWSMERLLAWLDARRWRDLAAALVLLGLAVLTRPHMMLLAGVGAIALLTRRAGGPPHWALAAIGAVMIPLKFWSMSRVVPNLVAFLVHLALAALLTFPWLIERWKQMPWRLLWVMVPLTAAAYFGLHPAAKWTAIPAMLSAIVLADIAIDGQWFLGAWLLLPLAALPYVHLPPKYLVATAPAMAVLIAARARRGVMTGAVIAGAALGVLIIRADAHLAELWREGAARFVAPHVRAGERVWFAGSWGFYWYGEHAGARPLTSTPPYPHAGDIVVVSSGGLGKQIEVVAKHTLIESAEDATPGGRIFGGAPAAGFYSNGFGNVPWTWGHDIINRFEVWRVD